MPELLMPSTPDTLLQESAHFCIYAQKRAAGKRPWGLSESGFYALDPSGNYAYKAHGAAALALKQGMGAEYVVSPYSSFLALPWCTQSALKNLRRLEKMGGRGRWGFIEALDFTPGRMEGVRPGLVRSYMAHHLWMSLLAVANTLIPDLMPGRFLADSAMGRTANCCRKNCL